MSDLIHNRLKYIRVISDKSSKYIELIKEIIVGINPSEYETIITSLQKLRETITWIDNIKTISNDLNQISQLYDNFIVIDKIIRIVLDLFANETYSKMAVYNMSSTYTTNIRHEKNNILLAYEKYLDMAVTDDEEIFNIVAKKSNTDKMFMYAIEHETTINKFTIRLIKEIIGLVSGEKRKRLELMVETQKDLLLKTTHIIPPFAGAQGVVVRYGLRSCSDSVSIEMIFDSFDLKYNTNISIDENWKLLSIKGPGLIIINKSIGTPIEFNLDGLIDLDYVTKRDLKTNPASGLTKKIIERFTTIKSLADNQVQNIDQAVKKYPGNGAWLIFETINGTDWRQLSQHNNQITGLFKGLSSRPTEYNRIHSETIIKNCFDRNAQMYIDEYTANKKLTTSSEPVRAAILDRITRNYKNLNILPTNASQFKQNVIDKEALTEILLDILTHTTGIYGKGSAEYMLTYIAKFDNIIHTFIKELERRWSIEKIPDRLFSEYSEKQLKNELDTIFIKVTTDSIDELDRSGIWTDYDMSVKDFFLERKQAIV